ncbi:16S rRNA (cytidine1402-2'-O)-methyltransferase [Chitinivorax tropicus]|uniref:16S rRNA (Cytidine1402-2'-O)-methyltransferase n=1 Tax=Chitinivorax tropicus TaxID=714531 RepID=A0A840MKG5_9PROT|nr:SAM-dependent methyltransferase [Chitinivorax tropicus]MBB5017639.1 16S rRNA (cytidine1402-2'-O)-methyltransferase [Chitinivorax tropicus]
MPLGTLYLIPAPLGDVPLEYFLPAEAKRIVSTLQHFVVEHPKTARLYLKQLEIATPLQQLQMSELNEHTPANAVPDLLKPLMAGHHVGLLSEAGCPAIADPGALLVRHAHAKGIRVKPLVGPSSILLALMASGANGQRFSFQGYLPADPANRARALKELEKRSAQQDEAIAFIETPYRNNQLLEAIQSQCRSSTLLCVASNLNTDDETIISLPIGSWPKPNPNLHKIPTVFVLYAKP